MTSLREAWIPAAAGLDPRLRGDDAAVSNSASA